MSHSTVCNTTVSTQKTSRTLVKYVAMPVACNAACVQGKRSCKRQREICVCASHQAWAWVRVCVIITQISSTQLLVCVCNGSAPGGAIKEEP